MHIVQALSVNSHCIKNYSTELKKCYVDSFGKKRAIVECWWSCRWNISAIFIWHFYSTTQVMWNWKMDEINTKEWNFKFWQRFDPVCQLIKNLCWSRTSLFFCIVRTKNNTKEHFCSLNQQRAHQNCSFKLATKVFNFHLNY